MSPQNKNYKEREEMKLTHEEQEARVRDGMPFMPATPLTANPTGKPCGTCTGLVFSVGPLTPSDVTASVDLIGVGPFVTDTDVWNGAAKEAASPQPQEELEVHCGGKASSSKCPRLSLFPREALLRGVERFEKGIENHGDRAWNAQSANQEILTDLDFLGVRIDHAMNHLMILSEKVTAAKRTGKFEMGDDDAAAILFFGAFACCATKALQSQAKSST